MGRKIDNNSAIHVEPLRVVIHFLDQHGGSGHESEGVREIGEFVLTVQFLIFEPPRTKLFDSLLLFLFFENFSRLLPANI